jgi:hypothetical protein
MLEVPGTNLGLQTDDNDNDDDHHVDAVSLRLRTAATNGRIVYPQVIYEPGELWWNYTDKGKVQIRPQGLSVNPTNRVI